MIPCEKCPVLAICRNKAMTKCPIVYQAYYDHAQDTNLTFLDETTEYLNKTDWAVNDVDHFVILYKPVNIKGSETMKESDVPYRLSNGMVVYHHKGGEQLKYSPATVFNIERLE